MSPYPGQIRLLSATSIPVVRLPFRVPQPGGDEEDRTPDPLLAGQVLSQLSYTPMFTGTSVPLLTFSLVKVHPASISVC